MGSTKAKWRGSQLAFYDGTTYETVRPISPRVLIEDFEGDTLNTDKWLALDDVGGHSSVAVNSGSVIGTFTADNENEEVGVVAAENSLDWDASKGLIIEFRAALTVLPTLVTEAHWGLLGEAQVDDKQIVSAEDYKEYCVFTADGDGVITINCDDNVAGAQHAVASGVTVIAGAYHIYRIDITDITNIIFYIDGAGVGIATTFTLDSLVSDLVQPVAIMTKHDGIGVGILSVDYIKVWQATR
jgi:hypothetical protein